MVLTGQSGGLQFSGAVGWAVAMALTWSIAIACVSYGFGVLKLPVSVVDHIGLRTTQFDALARFYGASLSTTDHAAVDAFYKAALAAGAADDGKPGLRTDCHPNYYAAFVIDPDGNNLESVGHVAG